MVWCFVHGSDTDSIITIPTLSVVLEVSHDGGIDEPEYHFGPVERRVVCKVRGQPERIVVISRLEAVDG